MTVTELEAYSVLASVIVAIAAVVISTTVSCITLYQNKKMIYEANKPIIEIYVYTTDVKHIHKYLVIKNFGKTSATITNLSFNKSLDEFNNRYKLASLIGGNIAPGQTFMTSFHHDFSEKLTATITYGSEIMKHEETRNYNLNFNQEGNLSYVQVSNSSLSDEAKAIINSAEAIVRGLQ